MMRTMFIYPAIITYLHIWRENKWHHMFYLSFCFPVISFIIVPPKSTLISGRGQNSSGHWTLSN